MDVKTVTRQSFLNWIMGKPKDAEFDMRDNYACESCGCLMVQYAKDTEGFVPEIINTECTDFGNSWGCGYREWQGEDEEGEHDDFAVFENDMDVYQIIGLTGEELQETSYTFGELQDLLLAKGIV